jgi:hypothetical protein
MDPRTELTGSPIGQAWTAFRAAASQNGPPVQYPRQRQPSQLQQGIRSSWRWFLHRSHGLTGHSLKWFQGRDKSFRTWGPMTRYSARQVPQSSARRFNCFPFRPKGVTIRSHGTKAPVKTLEVRDRRSPFTTRRMSRIAKGSLLQGPLFSKTSARADSQKRRSPIPFRIASCARKRESCWRGAPMLALSYPKEASYAQPH